MSLQFYSLKFCLSGDIGLVASFQVGELDQSVFVSIHFLTSVHFLYCGHVKGVVIGLVRGSDAFQKVEPHLYYHLVFF